MQRSRQGSFYWEMIRKKTTEFHLFSVFLQNLKSVNQRKYFAFYWFNFL